MAAILHSLDGLSDPLLLEEGVLWEFGGVQWRRLLVTGDDGRFSIVDEPDMSGYCCDHCNGDADLTPRARINDMTLERGVIRTGDTLAFGDAAWRIELRRGHASHLRDLFRISPPPEPRRFTELVSRFEEAGDAASAGGLLRFAHVPGNARPLSAAMLRVLPRLDAATVEDRAAAAALAIGLTRVGAMPRAAAKKLLERCAEDTLLDPWVHISALSVLALDEGATAHTNELRLLVMTALEEGDAPAAVAQACETLALVLEDEPLRSLGEAARAVVSDASARKRRTMAVAVLAALAERDPECARAVLRAAGDPHENVRAAAARALAILPDAHARSADAALLHLLGDAHDEVFEEAFAALFGGASRRVPAEALLAEVDRAGNDAQRLSRLTQALDRLA